MIALKLGLHLNEENFSLCQRVLSRIEEVILRKDGKVRVIIMWTIKCFLKRSLTKINIFNIEEIAINHCCSFIIFVLPDCTACSTVFVFSIFIETSFNTGIFNTLQRPYWSLLTAPSCQKISQWNWICMDQTYYTSS